MKLRTIAAIGLFWLAWYTVCYTLADKFFLAYHPEANYRRAWWGFNHKLYEGLMLLGVAVTLVYFGYLFIRKKPPTASH